jgi:ribonuclease P protein component
LRLTRPAQFDQLRREGLAKWAGPLRVAAAPNGLRHSRLGLAISRRVGSAVRRNRVKRMVREAFRLDRHELPAGYDLVVSAKAHEPAALDDYRRWLVTAMDKIDRKVRGEAD